MALSKIGELVKEKIKPFIEKFNIDMNDYLPEDGRDDESPYSNFNQFFIRRFKEGRRTFPGESSSLGAPAEARYYAYESLNDDETIPVKGKYLSPKEILKDERWFPEFQGGQFFWPGYVQLITIDITSLTMETI